MHLYYDDWNVMMRIHADIAWGAGPGDGAILGGVDGFAYFGWQQHNTDK
jgi:hypothetical protein